MEVLVVCCLVSVWTALAGINLPFAIRSLFAFSKRDTTSESIANFLDARAGKCDNIQRMRTGKDFVWCYEGILRNPQTGGEVVGISGLEFIRRLPLLSDSESSNSDTEREAIGKYLSKKIFIYTDRHNRSAPITSFRVNPIAPQRDVKPIHIMHEVVTVGRTTRSKKVSIGKQEAGANGYTSIQFPGGRTLHTSKLSISSSDSNGLFGSGPWSCEIAHFIKGGKKKSGGYFGLNRWISFAPGSQSDRSGRSQEYYSLSTVGAADFYSLGRRLSVFRVKHARKNIAASVYKKIPSGLKNFAGHVTRAAVSLYSNISTVAQAGLVESGRFSRYEVDTEALRTLSSATMIYKRHGECPPWYAPGRACATELVGYRLSCAEDVPQQIWDLIKTHCPSFLDEQYSSERQFGEAKDPFLNYKPWYYYLNPRSWIVAEKPKSVLNRRGGGGSIPDDIKANVVSSLVGVGKDLSAHPSWKFLR